MTKEELIKQCRYYKGRYYKATSLEELKGVIRDIEVSSERDTTAL